jgi:hypothetical protein
MATLQNAAGTNTADVNAQLELTVALTKVLANAGYAALVGENHDGSSGAAALRRSIYVSPEKRLGVGMDSILWDDTFNATVVNTRKYLQTLTTMTVLQSSGSSLTLNASALTTTTTAANVRSYKSFPVMGNFPTMVDFWFALTLVPQANNVIEIGWALSSGTATSIPIDGVYMNIDASGALSLNVNSNGTITSSGAITLPAGLAWTANRFYHGELVLHVDRAELYFDGVLLATVLRPASSGALTLQPSAFLHARLANSAATTGAQQLKLSRWSVTLGDGNFQRPWGAARTGQGDNLFSTPDGVVVAPLDNILNSSAPTSATLSNTAASYGSLGGNFQWAALAGGETDYALFAYQVPTSTANQPGKSLVITGIDIDTFNMGAAGAVTPTLMNWYLGVGSTAASLATADSATTRAPHKKFLGAQSIAVGTVVGGRADRAIFADFSKAPVVCEAGSFVHVIVRIPVATATATEVIRGSVAVKGYWE